MRTWLIFGTCIALAACGGGGGGGDDLATLQGLYAYAGATNQDSTPRYWTRWGDAFVEDDVATVSGVFNADGLLNSLNATYQLTVDEEGTLTLVDTQNNDPAPPEAIGKLTANGRLGVCTSTTGNADIHMFLRRDGNNMDDGDFQGDYHRISFYGTGDLYGSLLYDMFANGDGTASRADGISNFDGDPSALCPGGVDTYAVAEDGALSLLSSGRDWSGQLTPDGVLGILGGTMELDSMPGLMLLLRKAVEATPGTFSGTYCMLGFGYEPDSDEFFSEFGELVADGAGGYTASVAVNSGDGQGAPGAGSGTYTVDPDGSLSTLKDGFVVPFYVGGVSADGDYAILWGGAQDGLPPVMYLLFRP